MLSVQWTPKMWLYDIIAAIIFYFRYLDISLNTLFLNITFMENI